LSALGIDVSAIRLVTEHHIGRALIVVDDECANLIAMVAGTNAAMDVDDLEVLESVGPGDIALLHLEVPLWVVSVSARVQPRRSGRPEPLYLC